MASDYLTLLSAIDGQLPDRLRNRFQIRIRSDAYNLSAEAIFTDGLGKHWTVSLLDGMRLPEEFIAFLCTVPVPQQQTA